MGGGCLPKPNASMSEIPDAAVCGGNAAGARKGASSAKTASFLGPARGTAEFVVSGVQIGDHVIHV